MKIPSYLLIAAFIAYSAVSCGNKSSHATGSVNDTLNNDQQTTMYVWAENSRVRETPDLNGKVITELKAAEKVILTGETSSAKSKVKLRGVDFEDVWVKVKLNDSKEGWVFKSVLTEDENKAIAMNDFQINPGSNVGRVKLDATKDEVVAIYGAEFITDGTIYIGEGEGSNGFYLFKNSNLELQCALNDKGKIFGIYVRQPGAPWITPEGVKMGIKMEDLQKLNGKPFLFSGFGWDFGGGVYNYNEGNLDKYFGTIGITLGEPDNIEGLDEFMGDVDCNSSAKKLQGRGIRVVEIAVFGVPNV